MLEKCRKRRTCPEGPKTCFPSPSPSPRPSPTPTPRPGPDWADRGAILGLVNGSAHVRRVMSDVQAMAPDMPVAAVWVSLPALRPLRLHTPPVTPATPTTPHPGYPPWQTPNSRYAPSIFRYILAPQPRGIGFWLTPILHAACCLRAACYHLSAACCVLRAACCVLAAACFVLPDACCAACVLSMGQDGMESPPAAPLTPFSMGVQDPRSGF